MIKAHCCGFRFVPVHIQDNSYEADKFMLDGGLNNFWFVANTLMVEWCQRLVITHPQGLIHVSSFMFESDVSLQTEVQLNKQEKKKIVDLF